MEDFFVCGAFCPGAVHLFRLQSFFLVQVFVSKEAVDLHPFIDFLMPSVFDGSLCVMASGVIFIRYSSLQYRE